MITRILIYLALALAGVLGITMSMPLQAPAVIAMGLAGIFAGGALLVQSLKSQVEATSRGREEGDGLVEGRKVEGQRLESQEGSRGRDGMTGYSLLATRYLSAFALIYFIGRAWASPVMDLGMADLMLILPAGSLYFVAGYGVSGKSGVKLRQGMAWTVIALLICHLTSSIFQLQGGDGFSLARYFEATVRASQDHVTGMYGYYGSFANFAVIAGMLCLSLGVWGRFSLGIRGLVFMLGVIALGLAVYSQSRSAVMSLVASLMVFGVLVAVSLAHQNGTVRHRGRLFLSVLGVLALAVCGGGGIWAFKGRGGGREGFDMIFGSNLRVDFWSMAVEQWMETPFLGAGSRSYSYECFRYWSPNLSSEWANPEFVHNEYLQLLADYGLVGLLLILGLFVGHLWAGGKLVRLLSQKVGEDGWKQGSNAMALAMAGVCGMVAMSVHIIFDFRTHLLANLLLLVCCAVWVLPVGKSGGQRSKVEGLRVIQFFSYSAGGLMLCVLSFGAMALGGYQLWGGMPLLEHKVAKEDGAWIPEKVDRSVWIPVLEESISRVPSYGRSLRLATLYRLEAGEKSGEAGQRFSEKAKDSYNRSVLRNPFNPVPQINLAQMDVEAGEFEKADRIFRNASEVAKVRERWFKMHSLWAEMHYRWALSLWRDEKIDEADPHFLKAKELYGLSYKYGRNYHYKEWEIEYSDFMMGYARFLDTQKRFVEAQCLFDEYKNGRDWYWRDSLTGVDYYRGLHLYAWGYAIWQQRKPEKAYGMMLEARQHMHQYRGWKKGKVDASWQDEMKKIQEVVDFLEKAGIKRQSNN